MGGEGSSFETRPSGAPQDEAECVPGAREPDPAFPTSSVFRAGLIGYTKLFADKFAAQNIRMNNVLPGFIDSLGEKPEFKARIAMGRYGTTEEIAELISFLASERSGYITGQNIQIDGGITKAV